MSPANNVYNTVFLQAHPLNGAAVFQYESKCQQNLSFREGDIITLLEARYSVGLLTFK